MAVINGDNGPNTLNGTARADTIRGLGGDDTLNGLGGNDQLFGGEGNDTANGGSGIDTLRGGNGSDRLNGQASFDRLLGEDGDDRLDGGDGDDTLYGGNGVDSLFGRAGDDFLVGTAETTARNDFASDRLFGGDGDDFFDGDDLSTDQFFGESGNDTYLVDNDVAMGGVGNDFFSVVGSGGRVTGGADADSFSFFSSSGGRQASEITDFSSADTIDWSANGPGYFYTSQFVFDFFDSNNDDVISASDRSSTTPDGVNFDVRDTGPDLVLTIGFEDSVTFNNVGVINGADWA